MSVSNDFKNILYAYILKNVSNSRLLKIFKIYMFFKEYWRYPITHTQIYLYVCIPYKV